MEVKKAPITGITGQDGSFVAEFLLKKGYEVHGVIRRASTFNTGPAGGYVDLHERQARLFPHHGDVGNGGGLRRLIDMNGPPGNVRETISKRGLAVLTRPGAEGAQPSTRHA